MPISDTDRWVEIELRHLVALRMVIAEGSFSGAGRRLGYTQSAISQQIGALERIVGHRLIERPSRARPMSPTNAGAIFLDHAEAIVSRMRAAQVDLHGLSIGKTKELRVGVYQSVGAEILPRVARRLSSAWPEVRLLLGEAPTDLELFSLLENGHLDLTFATLPFLDGPFDGVQILSDPYVLVVPQGDPLCNPQSSIRLHDIGRRALLVLQNCRATSVVETQIRARGIDLNVVLRSDDIGTVLGFVTSGMGSALLPRLAIHAEVDGAVIKHLGSLVQPRLLGIAWLSDAKLSSVARAFVDDTCEVCTWLDRKI